MESWHLFQKTWAFWPLDFSHVDLLLLFAAFFLYLLVDMSPLTLRKRLSVLLLLMVLPLSQASSTPLKEVKNPDEQAVLQVLIQLEEAYASLDARRFEVLYPGLEPIQYRQLQAVFDQIERQTVKLQVQSIDFFEQSPHAIVRGKRYLQVDPKVGSQVRLISNFEIHLEKLSFGDWIIVHLDFPSKSTADPVVSQELQEPK